ncbi:MAG: hypothetical protein IVW57_06605 [Ktedonobacterales bacterium]|nr:hypothetical protein [Ktedonobacterales bacterium]
MGKFTWFSAGILSGLAAAAVSQELKKAPAERTWKGTIAGVPYNFRVPEWGEIANEYWNPSSDELVTPHVIGLGWGINLAAVKQRVEQLVGTAQHLVESRQNATDSQPPRRVPEPIER